MIDPDPNPSSTPDTSRGPVVRGAVVSSLVEVMGAFRTVALDILRQNHLLDETGEAVDPDAWYPLADWLACFDSVRRRVGPNTVTAVARHIATQGQPPSDVTTVEQAFALLDEAYRTVHRGEVGHYLWIGSGPKSCTIVSNTPYPSGFDEAVIRALIERYGPNSLIDVRLDPDAETRLDGGDSCTYLVSW